MKKVRVTLLILSAICILISAGYIIYEMYVEESETSDINIIPQVSVPKLAVDVERGQIIDLSHIAYESMDITAVPSNIIQSVNDILNKYATINLYAGEFLYEDRLNDLSPVDGKQRVAIDVTPLGAVAGKLERGQHVTIRVKDMNNYIPMYADDGSIIANTLAPEVDIITTDAIVDAVVDANLIDKEDFIYNSYTVENQAQSSFIPKYVVVWVTPEEAANIIAYDDTNNIRISINE